MQLMQLSGRYSVMQVVYNRCAGLDVHKKTVVACRIIPDDKAKRGWRKEVRTFGTTTRQLYELSVWLQDGEVTHVAMESTGIYWKPVYNILESDFDVALINARHIKYVPGRKTDVKDAQWIGELLQHGLVRASYVPSRPQRELRDLTRYRGQLVSERTREVNRIHKVLEDANIKLSSVASNVMGVSGVLMIEAIMAGEDDPLVLADLARGTLRRKLSQLVEALNGLVTSHHRQMLKLHFAHLDFIQHQLDTLDVALAEAVKPFNQNRELERLQQIPGVGYYSALSIIAEFGVEMDRFPSSAHASSWAGLAPGNNESAGKSKSSRTRKGNRYLKTMLVQAAHAAGRTKDNYLRSLYRRLSSRRGRKRAAVGTARSILVIAYHMLKDGTEYRDLGADHFDKQDQQRIQRRLIKRLEALGVKVSIEASAS